MLMYVKIRIQEKYTMTIKIRYEKYEIKITIQVAENREIA